MFITMPIKNFKLEDNKVLINESTIEYEPISDENREILESLISKGAYGSALLTLNKFYNIKSINESKYTQEELATYLSECNKLMEVNTIETEARNFRPLINLDGLEIMESADHIARGKGNKLLIEDFRNIKENSLKEAYGKTQLRFDLIDAVKVGARRYKSEFGGLKDNILKERILAEIDYMRDYFANGDGIKSICYDLREAVELGYDDYYDFDSDENEDTLYCCWCGNPVKPDFCYVVNESDPQSDVYCWKCYDELVSKGILEPMNEECEGTQCSDIAEKKDQEVGNLQRPPKKPRKRINEMFIIPRNHGFKGFRLNEQGYYIRGNYILIKENGIIKAVNKKLLEDNYGRYGELILSSEQANTRAQELCTALNTKLNHYVEDDPLYEFSYRLEEDMVKIFDTNECFDYESKEYTSGELDKIVQKYFGPMAYLEPENSVIFTIGDVIIEN